MSRRTGAIRMNNYLRPNRIGDYVDIMIDSAIHKGLPHYFYHGKTGKIFNLNKNSAGVVINKQVRNRIVQKKMNIRIEHLRPSRCRTAFIERIKANDTLKAEAKKAGQRISTKRQPAGPEEAKTIDMGECVMRS